MITLYGGGTPNVFKILIMLSETDLPFALERVNVAAEEQFRPEFVALNPNCKIPLIIDQDGPNGQPLVLAESGAILLYLAEKTGRFLPSEPTARARTFQWLMFQIASVGPMFGQAVHFTHAAPEGNEYGRQRYVTEVRRQYALMDAHLATNAYLAGEAFTIADMATYPWAANYLGTLGMATPRWRFAG
jgi:GST-like protein